LGQTVISIAHRNIFQAPNYRGKVRGDRSGYTDPAAIVLTPSPSLQHLQNKQTNQSISKSKFKKNDNKIIIKEMNKNDIKVKKTRHSNQ